MKDCQTPGGATLWARQTIESDIFYWKPAVWFKIWFYLVNRVNYKDTKQFKRGECFLQYKNIMDATNSSKDQVKHCIEYLKSASMIATRKTTRGMILKVLKYDYFQTLDNYYYNIKADIKATQKAKQKPHRSHTIVEECKECKNNIYIGIRDYWNKFTKSNSIGISNFNNTTVKQIGLLKECRRITPEIEDAIKKILKTYTEEDIQISITKYINEIINRSPQSDYSRHRFSLYEFLKQKNGFTKFINQS